LHIKEAIQVPRIGKTPVAILAFFTKLLVISFPTRTAVVFFHGKDEVWTVLLETPDMVIAFFTGLPIKRSRSCAEPEICFVKLENRHGLVP
jgi:hypothetical protein